MIKRNVFIELITSFFSFLFSGKQTSTTTKQIRTKGPVTTESNLNFY